MDRGSSGLFLASRSRHTRCSRDWSSDVCSSDLPCCIEAIIVFRSPLPRTAPWISADVLANHNQNCFSYNWNAMGDPRPAERMGTARTVNRRCQSGLWEGSSADSSSRFLTNAKDGLKKSLLAGLTIQVV